MNSSLRKIKFLGIVFALIFLNFSSFAQESGDSANSQDELAWFFVKFGDSTDYREQASGIEEKDFTEKQYEGMLSAVEQSKADERLSYILTFSLYKFAFLHPDDKKYFKFKKRMYALETLKKLMEKSVGLAEYLTPEQLKNSDLLYFAIRDCNWIRDQRDISNYGFKSNDLWKKLPALTVQKEAYDLMPCAIDLKAFFQANNFTRPNLFILKYLELGLDTVEISPVAYGKMETFGKYLSDVFRALPDHLKRDKKVVSEFLKKDILVYLDLPLEFKKDKRIIEKTAQLLKQGKAPPSSDKEKQYGDLFAEEILKLYPDDESILFVAAANSNNGENILTMMSPRLRNDPVIFIKLVGNFADTSNRLALQNIIDKMPNQFKKNKEVIKQIVIKGQPKDFDVADNVLRSDLVFVNEMITINPGIYIYSINPAKNNASIIKRVLAVSPDALVFVPPPYSFDLKLIKETLVKAKNCSIPESLFSNKKYMLEIIKLRRDCFSKLDTKIYDNDFHKLMLSGKITKEDLSKIPVKFLTDPVIIGKLEFPIKFEDTDLINTKSVLLFISTSKLDNFSEILEESIYQISIEENEEGGGTAENVEQTSDPRLKDTVFRKNILTPDFINSLVLLVKNKKENCQSLNKFLELCDDGGVFKNQEKFKIDKIKSSAGCK